MDFPLIPVVYFNYRTTIVLGLNCANRGPRIYSGVTIGFSPRGKEVVSYCSVRWKVASGDVIRHANVAILLVWSYSWFYALRSFISWSLNSFLLCFGNCFIWDLSSVTYSILFCLWQVDNGITQWGYDSANSDYRYDKPKPKIIKKKSILQRYHSAFLPWVLQWYLLIRT